MFKTFLRGATASLLLCLHAGMVFGQPPQNAERPRVADERVLLRTSRGDLVIALFPELAPKTVAQILKLVRMGVYDSTWFHRIEPGFVAQLTDAQNRRLPLTQDQRSAIVRLPLEASDIPHSRGKASMARQDGDVNSAETSFSLLLAPSPHLDGKYTVFGELESGEDVLTEIASTPRDKTNKPLEDILVQAAMVKTGAEIARMKEAGELRKAVPSRASSPEGEMRTTTPRILLAGLGIMIALSLAGVLLGPRLPSHQAVAFHLLTVLVGSFLLLRELVPMVRGDALLATAVFFGTVALFKLMNRFESDRQKASTATPEPPKPKSDSSAS